MIKCEINEGKNIVSIEVSGSLLDIVAETRMITSNIYNGLKKNDYEAAAFFEKAMLEPFYNDYKKER